MKLLVGLGNPGSQRAGSRHNIGFEIAVTFAREHGIALDQDRFRGRYGAGSLAPYVADATVGVLLPGTYMNASGQAVAAAVDSLGLDPERDLLVAYDDLDLPLGRLRLRPSGGAGGHNGVASVVAALGTTHFARLRFGIGRPPPGIEVVPFVLARFTPDEQEVLPGALERASAAVESAFREGVDVAMDRYNGAPEAEPAFVSPAPVASTEPVAPVVRTDPVAKQIVPESESIFRRIMRILSR